MISEFPKDWKKMVSDAADSVAEEKEYLTIVEALTRVDLKMVRRQHQYDPSKTWHKNAIEENKLRPFHAIVSSSRRGQAANLLDGTSIDPSRPHPLWNAPTSTTVRRRAADMALCVEVLLALADEIIFVDPYFTPRQGEKTRPLRAFLSAIANRGNRPMPSKIEYHTRNADTGHDYQSKLDSEIKGSLVGGSEFKVIRWYETEMHNRYILTNLGGVMFGHGLDESTNNTADIDTVTLVDEKTCSELMVDYSPTSSKLTWLNDVFTVTN